MNRISNVRSTQSIASDNLNLSNTAKKRNRTNMQRDKKGKQQQQLYGKSMPSSMKRGINCSNSVQNNSVADCRVWRLKMLPDLLASTTSFASISAQCKA